MVKLEEATATIGPTWERTESSDWTEPQQHINGLLVPINSPGAHNSDSRLVFLSFHPNKRLSSFKLIVSQQTHDSQWFSSLAGRPTV